MNEKCTKMKQKLLIMVVIGLISGICGCNPKSRNIQYPVAEKQDVTDNYFGTNVTDVYRWLEDDTTAAVADWVEKQNKVTQDYFSRIPFREKLKQRLTELTDYEKISSPYKKHNKYYYSKKLLNHMIIYVIEQSVLPSTLHKHLHRY